MMNSRYNVLIAAICLIVSACGNDPKKIVAAKSSEAKPTLTGPFRFHKAIEVSPGETYDVLSWGRGSKTIGSFMILHSDSAGAKYNTTTGDLDGSIIDVFNADMDTDGNPEILIQAKGKDTINYAKIYAFEFNNNNAHQLDFPRLTVSQRKGYRGNDNFYIKDGKLIREFPIYASNDSLAKPTGAKRQLEYGLSRNEFTVQQLSKDSVAIKNTATIPKAEVQQAQTKQKTSSSGSSRKKAEARKKRRRHRG